MKTKVITLISLLFLSCLATFAEVTTGVYLSKNADYDYASQTGTIKLESFTGQVTKMIHLGQSAEIVLVVDGSSSMKTEGMTKLHAAVKSFITELYDACADDRAGDNLGIDHRVSLVVYGNDVNMLCNFKSVYYETGTTPYGNAAAAATAFDNILIDKCKRSDGTYSSGGTMTHMALGLAYYIMEGNYSSIYTSDADNLSKTTSGTYAYYQNWPNYWVTNSISISGARSTDDSGNTCSRYVVLMTDGALEGTPKGGSKSLGDYTNGKEAARNEAVAVSRLLKADNVSIYTIGFLDSDDNVLNNMLNNVSSNWLTPISASDPVDYTPHDYFSLVSKTGDASALSAIFNSISGEIASGCAAVTFDESTTQVTDVLNNTYFALPAGADADDIKIYTIPCTGYNATTRVYSFETDETKWGHPTVGSGTSEIHVVVNETDGSVEVTNFNFTDNFCGMVYDTGTSSMKAHGCKLVIEIPFAVKEFSEAIGTVPTNADGSGFTGKTNATPQENFSQKFTSPDVDLYELNITRSGLKNGESAIFTVSDEVGNIIYTIVLTGNGGTVSQKMLFVPAGEISVTETKWNSSTEVTKVTDPVISAANPNPTIAFTGSSLGIKEDAKPNLYDK